MIGKEMNAARPWHIIVKFSYMRPDAFLLLLLAATADTQWAFLPTCAQSCPQEGVAAATNCDSTDYKCLCETHEFHLVSTCCVRANCDSEDDSLVFDDSQSFCDAYGVAITKIPDSECTSTFGASVATATATATATGTGTGTGSATVTAEPFTVTNTVSISNGRVTTVTFTYSPSATSTASAGSSSSGGSTSNSDNDNGSSDSGSSTSAASNGKNHSGLSQGAKIGIGVGAGVGGLAIIAGIIWLSVYCCCAGRRRKSPPASSSSAATAYTPVNTSGDQQDEKPAAAVNLMVSDSKPELDAQQVQQPQQQQQALSTLSQAQQHNPAAVPSSALPAAYAAPISPIDGDRGRTSFAPTGSSGGHNYYYQSPDGGVQEMSGTSSYRYDTAVATQAEMPADNIRQYATRYELQ
ncbi:hypothetical protein UA08_02550 [Talaromyces atroroseus]|uniref:CFEM domain-containing protein n=1 Tax=Talaromyces atroroseus TaxID=1441469 RepID=A0A225AXD0_TALAT|nr:hypothetical protein UA08_02550 [Talaromyces atroroseus]OKL61988.1 hypothetical protein UA08_02550 [Talaromyces atroroseus]